MIYELNCLEFHCIIETEPDLYNKNESFKWNDLDPQKGSFRLWGSDFDNNMFRISIYREEYNIFDYVHSSVIIIKSSEKRKLHYRSPNFNNLRLYIVCLPYTRYYLFISETYEKDIFGNLSNDIEY